MTSKKIRGFSLLELMAVIGISFTLTAISIVTLMPLFQKSHIDDAFETSLATMRDTRNLSIAQGHEYWVAFDAITGANPAKITVLYQPAAVAGVYPARQTVNTYTLPIDINFVTRGYPASTPDGFGTGAAAIDFGYTLVGGTGGSWSIVFMPDGSARDGTDPGSGGNLSSGVVYMTRSDGPITDSRAITVWGATGRIRGWRLNSIGGADKWVQE